MSHLARARIGQALVILLATALPAVAAAQTVCEMLIEGTPASVPSTPVAVPGNPDISHLYIQVRTTRPLKSLVAGVLPSLVHK
jgi:hypothetical protein